MLSWLFPDKYLVCRPEMIMDVLEERIVLDAAVSPVPQDNPNNSAPTDPQAHQTDQSTQSADTNHTAASNAASAPTPDAGQQVFQKDLHVVLVSNALDQVKGISAAAADDAKVIVYDAYKDNLATINTMLSDLSHSTGQKIGALAIVGHGEDGLVQIGADQINSSNLFKFIPTLEALATNLSQDAQIQFYGCSIAKDADGKALINQIATYTHSEVFASSDNTGGNGNGWSLEYASQAGTPQVTLFNADKLPSDGPELLFPGSAPLDSLTNLGTPFTNIIALSIARIFIRSISVRPPIPKPGFSP